METAFCLRKRLGYARIQADMKNSLFPATLCLWLPIVGAEELSPMPNSDSAPAVDAAEEGDYEEEADIIYTPEQQADALAKLKACSEQSLLALRSVYDHASADAAVALLQKSKHTLTVITPILGSMDQNEVMSILFITGEQQEEEIRRLAKAQFYGSEALAKELTGSAALVRPAATMPDELKELFLHKEAATTPAVSGGPGYTQETAWVLEPTETDDRIQGSLTKYMRIIAPKINQLAIYEARFGIGAPMLKTVFANGKVYVHLTFDLLPKGDGDRYILEQWLDITACALIRSEEDMLQYAEEGVHIVADIIKLLSAVSDKDSADKAADTILALSEKISPKHSAAIGLLSEEQTMSLAIESGISPEKDGDIIERIIDADFFGSKKLEKAMENLQKKI